MMKKSSSETLESPPPTSFSSLPYDVTLNCLARISRIHYPTLSLVSKHFRSLITSRDLHATRRRIEKTEDFFYVCLNLNWNNNTNPSWFTLPLIPKHHNLKPIPSLPYQHYESSTVLSTGSEIYIIGGFVDGMRRSNRVLILDCISHQWRRVSDMCVARETPAADVINGKIYVIGGSLSNNVEDWGEVYDLKTQTWEVILPTTLDLTIQKSLAQGSLVMDGKVYDIDGLKLNLKKNVCLVEIEKNVFSLINIWGGYLMWRDPKEGSKWRFVHQMWPSGGNGQIMSPHSYFLNPLISVVNSAGGGKRVTFWWKSVVKVLQTKERKTAIQYAQVSFERRGVGELCGIVDLFTTVFYLDECNLPSDFFLHSAIVTH